MIAGDVHLRCHQDRKIGKFLLQLLLLSDFDGSSRKTCKNDDDDDDADDDDEEEKAQLEADIEAHQTDRAAAKEAMAKATHCLLYTSPSPRD